MRRLLVFLGVFALTAVVVIGVLQASGEGDGTSEQTAAGSFDLGAARERLAGAPAPLGALHDQSSELLGGGTRAFERRLAELEGHPVVVNKWASWCGPCRLEFPYFQAQAAKRGRSVAFVGIDAKDNRETAEGFLEEFPVPFPSYLDPDEKIARSIRAPANFPVTVFIDARGRTAYIHQGQYRDEADLAADIDEYL